MASLKEIKPAAELLAAKADWPPLYDCEQLKGNMVPVASATYFEVGSLVCRQCRHSCCVYNRSLQETVPSCADDKPAAGVRCHW